MIQASQDAANQTWRIVYMDVMETGWNEAEVGTEEMGDVQHRLVSTPCARHLRESHSANSVGSPGKSFIGYGDAEPLVLICHGGSGG
ncbi:hypothetical protein ECG_06193 [Echinococcus granulosus]|nr:hypothetical protein ECG_06193 [Echinococcus granulosus]